MKIRLLTLFTISVVAVSAQTNDVVKVKVTGDRVSLRAKPDINSELLESAMRGEELVYLGRTNGWVAVQPPDNFDFWAAGEYIQNGVVSADKLNIRSGPNKNYSVVHVASKGDALTLRGEFNEWIKVAPPPGSRVWISDQFVETIEPPKPAPVVEAVPVVVPEPAPAKKPMPVAAAPKLTEEELKPLVLVLDKTKEQGAYDEIPGVLRRANPGLYKLVLIVGEIEETICLVRGQEAQMEQYLNRAMLIKGTTYWVEGVPVPVIKTDKIHLDPILEH